MWRYFYTQPSLNIHRACLRSGAGDLDLTRKNRPIKLQLVSLAPPPSGSRLPLSSALEVKIARAWEQAEAVWSRAGGVLCLFCVGGGCVCYHSPSSTLFELENERGYSC
ncbi:hypothetical protein BaRGS_00005001 [Batillaria attramentaria]|uniref:Uncharacterized protein n=1 Tax=Batillaria attramentaria TaxID=370345 RepID=A0ABD0LXQ5_9CAEN